MDVATLTFDELELSSHLTRDLINEKDKCSEFVGQFFSIEAIREQISRKDFDSESRNILVKALRQQNEGIELSQKSKSNIESLNEPKTFTITTGHQLNLMTGPLYSIYKITQTISLSRTLNETYPDHKFVPVFWMATEDHDFAEINHFRLFSNTIRWEIDSKEKVVGRLELEGIDEVLQEVESKFDDESLQKQLNALLDAYRSSSNLAEATRKLINKLFGEHGLVIIDGDDAELKRKFFPVIREEIKNQITRKKVAETNERLKDKGYHEQVYVRPVNLFHIHESGKRERIETEGDQFKIGEKTYAVDELLEEAKKYPESFSPNALLRPVYQEVVLPNLVYLGGGGEIAYWMQLKSTFEAFEVIFPLIRVRDSYILSNEKDEETLKTFDLTIPQLKEDINPLINEWVAENSSLDLNLDEERQNLKTIKQRISEKAKDLDPNLQKTIEGEFVRWTKSVDNLEDKLIKSEKKNHERSVKNLKRLKEKIFPDNGFQERSDNFLFHHLKDENFIKGILELKLLKDTEIKILKK